MKHLQTMESPSVSPFSFLLHNKTRKASISSATGTLDSSFHSGSILGDSLNNSSCVGDSSDSDEPLIRQLRHSGTMFASEVHDRASNYADRTVLKVELAKKNHNKQIDPCQPRVEDIFASHMNLHQTRGQLSQLREARRSNKSIIVQETEGDALEKSLSKYWAREQFKSVKHVTCNLHHLVLVGEEDKIMTYHGYQFSQAPAQHDFSVSSSLMKSCSA
mmetsp:Transcript_12793/g.24317  ORF Transcript_12793/g.24317 Transcript_12793/m.24317 type:complete len:218 (-) Transcript_12793:293-946(-)